MRRNALSKAMITPSDFVGRWNIARVIDDKHAGGQAHFAGTALIACKDKDWVYSETGVLEISGIAPMQAERTYLWRPDDAGFDIFFDDKRFFHRFDLDQESQARHWCDPDQYEVQYDLSKWPSWQSTWIVLGPKKNYVLKNRYSLSETTVD
ncbi:DUF6314 family protein [Planktotalea sp.]|uniref:DUF6314 family protein n=1 Tax=Planktotalea sp. TaxID=2029877 RepID=UPI003D6A3684